MTEWEVWRRGTIRMLLIAGGAFCMGRGCTEGSVGGAGFRAVILVIAGLVAVLVALKPREGG